MAKKKSSKKRPAPKKRSPRSASRKSPRRKAPPASSPAFPSLKAWLQADRNTWIALAIVLLLTALAFAGGFGNEFTNWDDDVYVTENPFIRGLGGENLRWIFSEPVAGNYHPLTMLSLALNYSLTGSSFAGFFAVNLLFHLLNTLLVFGFVWLLSERKLPVALVCAFFFVIHPMHVESVAWIAERKDVLYTFFFFLSLISYLRYRLTKKRTVYFWTLVFFILSVLSKPAAVVLPVVLLLVDYYQAREWSRAVWLEKIPFFLISLLMGWVTLQVQEDAGALTSYTYSLVDKIMVASYAFLAYLGKFFLPLNLSAYHPYPPGEFPLLYKIAPLLVLGLAGLVWWSRKWGRWGVFGSLFYLVNIALVLQVISVGDTVISERYTYVPYVGLLFIIGIGLNEVWEKRPRFRYAVLAAGAIVALISLYGTWQRVGVWKNTGTIFSNVIEQYPYAARPYISRGHYRAALQQADSALADYNRALALKDDHMAYNNRGDILLRRNQLRPALRDFERATRVKPDFAIGYGNQGVAYFQLGKIDSALLRFNQAIRLNPRMGFFYYLRSLVYKRKGQRQQALQDARQAQRLGHAVPQDHLRELGG